MTKDEIKKLIEEEAERYADSKGIYNQHGEALLKMGFKKGANFILSKWQEAERWRKFTTDDLPNLGMRILLKNGNRRDTTVVHSHQHIHELAECFTEWKPIS
ncbi:hypothetical protein [Dysgonomonas mossii]|uniref:Uncharacterized protein n=1 Tax=Dysgonomonas mossii DSM 22836 TaxID=742767 RepID=F8X574_9BACT|nr:hypothetical protein [Dysgonomonas mossii]EGK04680.1 hypothetical protein HMPREF9456_03383 [Dysgonomonas mossii DSM 22836]